jgi:REP element-mobilizing transposase RayT
MPRGERKISGTGIYHIVIRGINGQQIFEDDEDYEKFIENLSEVKKQAAFELFAYCQMSNHVHLLIKEGGEPVSLPTG